MDEETGNTIVRVALVAGAVGVAFSPYPALILVFVLFFMFT